MATILSELIVDHGISFPLLILLHGGSLLLLLLLLLMLLLLLVLLVLLESGLSRGSCSLLRSPLFHNILWRSTTSFTALGQIRLPGGCVFRSRIVETDLFPVQCFTKELVVIRMNVMRWKIFLAQFVLEDFSHDRTQSVAVRRWNLSPMTGAIDVTHLVLVSGLQGRRDTSLFQASLSSGTTPRAFASWPEDIWLISER